MKIALAIINKNEEQALPFVLDSIPYDCVDLVFCVDGRSTDSSVKILEEHKIHVIRQEGRGRGDAFRLAFKFASKQGVDAIIFFSPDGNEDAADIPKFRNFLEHGFDMVIASRMMEGGVNEEDQHWIRTRKWGNLFFDWLAFLTWGRGQRRITDAINGYRAITTKVWYELQPDSEGYLIEYQTSILAYKKPKRVVEFPTTEGPRIGGKSDASAVSTGIRMLRLYLRELQNIS